MHKTGRVKSFDILQYIQQAFIYFWKNISRKNTLNIFWISINSYSNFRDRDTSTSGQVLNYDGLVLQIYLDQIPVTTGGLNCKSLAYKVVT